MLRIDDLVNTRTCVNGKWVIARPLPGPFISRLKDALQVILGKADAVKFYKQ
jgi:hypothetical protein